MEFLPHIRKQRVSIDGIVNKTRVVTYGVPQGTVLVPILKYFSLNKKI